jgi:hypothetical protein
VDWEYRRDFEHSIETSGITGRATCTTQFDYDQDVRYAATSLGDQMTLQQTYLILTTW